MTIFGLILATVLSGGWTADGVPVEVPHTWNAVDAADGATKRHSHAGESVRSDSYARRRVVYRRSLPDAPAKGVRAFVRVNGASQTATVSVNGKALKTHRGAFTPFVVEVTEALKATNNAIEIAVDNFVDANIPPVHADFSLFGGLYREVEWFEGEVPRKPLAAPRALPNPIRGVSRHQDFAGKGWAVSPEDEARDVALMKELGVNLVRTAHYPTSDHFYTLCDEAGIAVISEASAVDFVTDSPSFRTNYLNEIREMVEQFGHHPSIVAWGLFNEMASGEAIAAPIIAEGAKLLRELDPKRPIYGVADTWNANKRKIQGNVDLLGFNLYPGWYSDSASDFTKLVDQCFRDSGVKSAFISEYGAGGSPFHHDLTGKKIGASYAPFHPEEYQALVHEIEYRQLKNDARLKGGIIWCLADFASDVRDEGDACGINDKGLVTYDRKTKKDVFYFYQANWSKLPVLHIVGSRSEAVEVEKADLRVYSNVGKVALTVNGQQLGEVEPDEVKVAVFMGVEFRHGANEVIATAGGQTARWAFRCRGRAARSTPPQCAEILVGVTGYGKSPEFSELKENDECNLWVQWEHAENLLPEYLGDDWCAWAKTNGIRVMTIYGQQNAALTKKLKNFWGDYYLGNNLGEYASFLYQDEKSYAKEWPKCRDLKEAHDWLIGSMLARPKANQLARSPEEREPRIFSTSGSPLACYELQSGIDFICNEMYAVGCGNIAYATAEARGAAKRFGRDWWSAWLAHEWQTCWPRVPYLVAQKMDSLEVGLKEMWLMGTSMMVLESGTQSTQAQNYTPLDGTMAEFSTPKQFYDDPVPKAYRRTMKEFYQWTKAHPRTKGSPVVKSALLLGNYDGYVGMTFDLFAIFGQHHLAETNANWRCGAPEFTWETMMETFFPRPTDALRPYANGWLGGTPHGQLDVVNVDDTIVAEKLSPYRVVVFGGWNTMTKPVASALRKYVAKGGKVVITVPQLSARLDREYSNYTAADLVQAVPGVKVGSPYLAEDILMIKDNAPEFLKRAYPAHLSTKLRVAEATLGENVEVLATMGKKPYLVKAKFGQGAFYLVLAWDYPAARREREEFPSFRSFRLDFWKTLATGLVDAAQPERIEGEDAKYVNWAVYPDGTAYLLNTDCVGARTVRFRGETLTLAPKEMKYVSK